MSVTTIKYRSKSRRTLKLGGPPPPPPYTSVLQKPLTTEVKVIGWNFLKASILRDTYYLVGVFVELMCTAPSSFIVRLDFDLQLPITGTDFFRYAHLLIGIT